MSDRQRGHPAGKKPRSLLEPGWQDRAKQTMIYGLLQDAANAFTAPKRAYQGLLDPMSDEAIGNMADLAGMVTLGAGAVPATGKHELRAGIKAYHGSPHDFDRFNIDDAGADALWFSNDKRYADTLAGRTNLSRQKNGRVYEVDVDMRKPLDVDVQAAARAELENAGVDFSTMTSAEIEEAYLGGSNFESLADFYKPDVAAGGHDGIVFRGTYDGFQHPTDQYVVFDENLIEIVKKYGLVGALGAGLITEQQAQAFMEQHKSKTDFEAAYAAGNGA